VRVRGPASWLVLVVWCAAAFILFRRPSAGVFIVVWFVLFFGTIGFVAVVFIRRAAARAHQERVAPEYQADVPVPVAPAHVWGPAEPTRPLFDAPGGLPPCGTRIVTALRDGNQDADNVIFGGESTTVGTTIVTAFDHASWDRDEHGQRCNFTHEACAHFALAERVPYTLMIAKSIGEYSDGEASELGLERCEFESDDFNRTFTVVTKDRNFATAFVSEQVIELALCEPNLRWVLAAGADVVVALTPPPATDPSPWSLEGMGLASGPMHGIPARVANPELPLRFVVGLLDRLPDELRPEKTSTAGPAS
jgi:hypothetical protein